MAMGGDMLDHQLALLADAISVSNPTTFGQTVKWRTTQKNAEIMAKQEHDFAKTLPQRFVLTELRNADDTFALVAAAAKNPTRTLHSSLLINADNCSSAKRPGDSLLKGEQVALSTRVPIAKRSHMEGILRGIPGGSEQIRTVQQRAFVHDNEMDRMNRDKDTSYHRKRDAYSDYVEARARFSKMHSVK